MATKPPVKNINLRIPVDVYDSIAAYAKAKDRSVSWVASTIIATAARRMPAEIVEKG